MSVPADLSFVTLKDFADFLGKPTLLSDATAKVNLTDALGAATEAVEAIVGPLDNDEHTFTVIPSGTSLVLPDSHIVEPVTVKDSRGDVVAPSLVNLEAGVLTFAYHLHGPHQVTYTTREHGYSVRMALKVIASHLYDVYRGNPPARQNEAYTPIEDAMAAKAGFAIPRRASQLLAPFMRGQ